MMSTKDSRYTHPWEYPDCPNCEIEIYVGHARSNDHTYECHKCGEVFTT